MDFKRIEATHYPHAAAYRGGGFGQTAFDDANLAAGDASRSDEQRRPIWASVALLFGLLAFVGTGCTVTLIAPYDDATVNAVTELLKKTDTFLLEIASDLDAGRQADAAYEKHRTFYDETRVSLNVIRVRAEAIPKNERTVAQLSRLEDAFLKLEDQHKKGFSKDYVTGVRKIIDQAIGAILAAEFAKKRP